jgi:hypothetical protein
MNCINRLQALAERARGLDNDPFYEGCKTAYESAIGIVNPLQDAVTRFCKRDCFYGRKEAPGLADECGICPLAPFTTDIETIEEAREIQESKAAIASRLEREKEIAQRALAELKEHGRDSTATTPPVAGRDRCMRAGDERD